MKKLLLSFLFLLHASFGFSQLVEDFENTTGITGSLPATWTLGSGNWTVFERNMPSTVGTSQSWGINAFATGIQFEGTECASVSREDIGAGNTSEDYLVTPPVTIPLNGQLRFYTRMFTPGDQGTIYKIMVAPAFAPADDASSYTLVEEWTEDNLITPTSNYNVWTEKTVDLSDYAGIGIDVYIAFVRVYTQPDANINGDRWLIDNVGTFSFDPCSINAVASYLSPTVANLSWSSSEPVEVMILPCSDPNPTPTENGVVVSGNNYQFTNLIADSCYKVFIKTSCPTPNTWHGIPLTNQYAPINLVAFVDTNNNGIKDSGEAPFTHGYFSIRWDNTEVTYNIASFSGSYSFIPNNINDILDFGYAIDPFYSQCMNLGSFDFNDIPVSAQTVQTLYFPIIPVTNCFDNRVRIYSYSGPRVGLNDTTGWAVSAWGDNPVSNGILTYTKDPNQTIVSVTPSSGIIYTPTGFTYNYSGLSTQPIYVYVTTSTPPIPTVNIGDLITRSVSISFSPSDMDSSNNNHSISLTARGSYDPNDINESHGPQIQFDQFSSNDYLDYTIRFQNTGNANAIRVLVNDVLDSRIDENSIEMIAARHDYIMVRRGNTVSWEFNNIQLPPASINEDLSNGFVTFRVKLKPGFAIGDIIPATASIYFDSNPAIVTETFNTEFVQLLGNPNFDNDSVSLYPNPAKSTVQITQTGNEGIEEVAFFDVTGKLVKTISNIINSQEAIDISTLAKGIYFVEITNTADIKTIKKLIIQ